MKKICFMLWLPLILISCTTPSDPGVYDFDYIPDIDRLKDGDSGLRPDADTSAPSCNYTSSDNKIKASSVEMQFSGIYRSFAGTQYVTITNNCYKCTDSGLTVEGAEILPDPDDPEAPEAFSFALNPVADDSVEIFSGDKLTFGISCDVVSWDTYERTLRIYSNDKCKPEYDVKLMCLAKASSRIAIKTPDDDDPDDMAMKFVKVQKELVHNLQVLNEGTTGLRIMSMVISVGQSSSDTEPGFFIKTPITSDKTIEPNFSMNAEIGCRNSKEFPLALNGELQLRTNDDTENGKNIHIKIPLTCGPETTSTLKAVLKCDPAEVPVYGIPLLDATASTNTDGTSAGLQYYWAFQKVPSGSGVKIFDFEDQSMLPDNSVNDKWSLAGRAKFIAMLKGAYEVRMMVRNDKEETSSWASCTINAIPNDDLMIKMIWTNKNSDVDLHLISPGGTYGDPKTDCYYYNCSPQYNGQRPDWGTANDVKDDPFLDFDNTTGMGPETITINRPINGTYKVVVHAYDTDAGPSSIVVKGYQLAVEEATATGLLSKTNTCWDVFNITVSDGANGHKNVDVQTIQPFAAYECKPPKTTP